MNRIYKVIWSKVKHQYVVVSELAHSCTKSAGSRVGRSAAAVLAALVLTTGLCAAPVQAEDLTDPYAIVNARVKETNSTSSDTLVKLVQSPAAKSIAPLANKDAGQPGAGSSSTVTTPAGQHMIYNEEGFYVHNGNTYNSLTKDGLFVGGTDNGEGLYVDNDGNIYTDGNAEIEGSFSAANGNATIAADGSTTIQTGSSQLVVSGNAAGMSSGNGSVSVSNNSATLSGASNVIDAGLNGITLAERTGNTTVTVDQDGMTVDGDFAVTGDTNLKNTDIDGDLSVSGSTHIDGGLTAGNLQTAGQLHAGSAVIDGGATVGGKLTAGDVDTNEVNAHNVSIDNELAAGKADIEGALTAGSADITGSASVGGILTAGDIQTEGTVTAANADITNLTAGKADIEGTMTAGSAAISGDATIDGTATVGGLTTVGTVTANTVDTTNLNAGKADIEGTMTAGSVSVTYDATVGGNLSVTGAANLDSTLTVDGATTVNNTLDVTGDTTLGSDLGVTGTATVGEDLIVTGDATASNVTATGTLDVTGATTLGSTLDVTGAANLDSTLTVDGATTVNNTLDVTGDTTLGSDLGVTGTATVGEDLIVTGDATAANVTATGTLDVTGATTLGSTLDVTGATTLTGALTANGAATFTQGASMNNQKITNVLAGTDGTDAVNKDQLDAVEGKIKTYTAGDGIDITSDEISVKSADNNIEVDGTGVSLADDINVTSVTTTGAANVGGDLSVNGTTTLTGALTANGTATFTQGASMNNQKITGVLAGTEGTDAVNKDQLDAVEGKIKTYTAGDGIDITSDEISVKSADANIVVDGTGVSLADDISVTSVTTTGAANVGGTLSVAGTTTLTGALTANGAATFTQGASMNNQKITGVLAGTEGTDAVNKDQLDAVEGKIKTYTAGDGIDITSDEISVKSADNNIVVDGTGVSLADDINVTSVTTTGAANVGGNLSVNGTTTLTGALTANGAATFTQGASMNGQKITGVATGVDGTDAVNVDQLNAAIATVDGEVYTEGNGIDIDEADNNKISVKAAADGNLEVDGNGVSLKDNINLTSVTTSGAVKVGGDLGVTGTTTLTGALTANGTATFTQGASMNNQKITGVLAGTDGTDAVNKSQLDAVEGKIKTYTAGDGIDITSDEISVKSADNNIVVDGTGVSLADDINVTSVTTGAANVGGNLSVTGTTTLTGALTANGAATFTQGASMNNQKITGVLAGTDGTDAVNKNQLDAVEGKIKTYTAGDGIDITSDEISVKSADNNIVVDGTGVSLADDISVTSVATTGAANVGGNLSVAGTTTLTGATTINSTLGVTGAVTAASVTAGGGFTIDMNNSLTSSGLTIGGTQYITSAGLNAGNKVITGVANGVNDYDAVNMSQLNDVKEVSDLAVTYTNAQKTQIDLAGVGGTTITNVADGVRDSDAVNKGQLDDVDEKVGTAKWNNTNFLNNVTDLTTAAGTLDNKMGSVNFNDTLLLQSQTNLTGAIKSLDTHIGDLNFNGAYHIATNSTVTAALNSLDDTIGPMSFGNTTFLKNATTVSSALDLLDSRFTTGMKIIGVTINDDGTMANTISWDGFNYISGDASVVTGMRNLDSAIQGIDDRVTTLETANNTLSTFSRSNISTLSALSNMDMSAVNTLSSLSADDLAAISTLSEDGSVPAANSDPNSRPDRGPSSGSEDSSTHDGNAQTMDHDLNVTGNVSVGGTLDVTGEANFGSNVNVSGDLDVTGETNMHGTLNMNNNKITGVAAGEISADSTDAVNGSQLHDAWQQINSNTENIGILGSAVNKLGDRIERVGAGAAALAALHPLDFDPDNKLDFAAGFGNYRGASAVAVGAFYRPSENVMFSVGGAFGGGEDMVNAGVSFKVGAGSGSATTSRTAMAKSLKSMQEVVASQDAQLAQQREQIDKLTAMVELLMEQNGQAQPKDGDAQAGQP